MDDFLYFENRSNDPTHNLAFEEFLFSHRTEPVFLLWRNAPAVIIGRYQNTVEEIDADFVRKYSIHVVRRNSGGGAVYHDLGNLNFSLIVNDDSREFDFARFTQPVIRTLREIGVPAENSGRNDILVDGRKISGNAQYRRRNRVLHHGTILFDTDLDCLSRVLGSIRTLKYASRATASVRSRVANVSEFLKEKFDIEEFQNLIFREIQKSQIIRTETMSTFEQDQTKKLRDKKYRRWDWNYGKSPSFECRCAIRNFEWGLLDVRIGVAQGIVKSCTFYGDFFALDSPEILSRIIVGHRFEREELDRRLSEEQIASVFPSLGKEDLLNILFPETDSVQ